MKKKLFMLCAILALVMLAACGKDDSDTNKKNADKEKDEDKLVELKVDLDTPEKADVDEKVHLKATVTFDGDEVKDADEVEYEIWEKGVKGDSQMHEAKNNKDGTYTLETSFDKDGDYDVQVHVTAREQHNMPKTTIVVGEGSSEEHADHESADEHHEHGKTEGFSMHFMEPENVKAKDKEDLIVHLQLDDKPLEKAKVRYEIVRGNEKKVEWPEAKEIKAGEYKANFEFAEKGTYKITVHVENDEGLHEHEEHELVVK